MTTTIPVPARQRLQVAQVALDDARAAFLREAADTTDSLRLDFLYTAVADLERLGDEVAQVLR